ncbi:Alpha-1-antiproteinase [Eumeta japonica]|uniref:Alpha-1-antiproteinase n=1 Tax=Eumeta variegata TaxID=151549 RepID=A0A4C1ZTA7_EUMVA|nr:Alpha-1-antiproteinase [Eumeta japonica]
MAEGIVAVMAAIATTHAQNIDNGYFSRALAFFFPPFLRNVASQSYPTNDAQQIQSTDFNSYYYSNPRWNRVQNPQNPFTDYQRTPQYGPTYDRPQPSKDTRTEGGSGQRDSRRGEVPSNTRNVEVTSRIASRDDVQDARSPSTESTSGLTSAVSLNKVVNVNTRFANSKPDDEVAASPDAIVFRDRQSHEDGVDGSDASIALTGFGLTMMKSLNAEQTKNPAISPYSVAELLALLQQGAAGNSELEITRALLMTPTKAKESFRALLDSVKVTHAKVASYSGEGCSKSSGICFEHLYASKGISNSESQLACCQWFRTFKNTAVRSFDSDVTPINFNNAYSSAQQINSWVAEKTQNQIPELISPDMLEPNTQMVLANAIFFKGLWRTKFDPSNTTSGDFHLSDGSVKRVQYMRARFGLPMGLDQQTDMLYAVMPFEGEQYKMMFLMPEVDDLKTAINKLNTEKLLNFLMVKSKDVRVAIPKFTVQSDRDLKTVLNMMGIREIFGHQAKLFNVGTYRTLSPHITAALHKAVVSIDEQGGVAAAVTAFPAVALSFGDSTINFELNKPFLMILWDAENKVPLFMARVDDPTV